MSFLRICSLMWFMNKLVEIAYPPRQGAKGRLYQHLDILIERGGTLQR